MFEEGDLIYCPGDNDDDRYPGWTEDWGIVIKVEDENYRHKYHIHWLLDKVTCEDHDWAHKYCELAASAK